MRHLSHVVQAMYYHRFLRQTRHTERVQQQLLKHILRRNRHSRFGTKHRFSTIGNYQEFAERIAVHDYESLRPYLLSEEPRLFSVTSGTTAAPKLIPIFDETVKDFRRQQAIYSYAKERQIPGIHKGKILSIVSPAVEGHLENGRSYGSMSGLVQQSLPRALRERYVLSQEILSIQDYDLKYRRMAEAALAERDISLIGTANPTSLLRLQQAIVQCEPKHAQTPHLFSYLWPHLKAVCTWTAGNCSFFIPKVRELFSPSVKLVELGYLATEFRGSIVLDTESDFGVPTISDNFFEFQALEKPDHHLLLHELEEGEQYRVIITTKNGLYRYDINDIITVGPRFYSTPTIKFVQKGAGVVSITGEKLYESQVMRALEAYQQEAKISFNHFLLCACEDLSGYQLFVEGATGSIDISQLERFLFLENIEFKAKRLSQRLATTRLRTLPSGSFEALKKKLVSAGQREAQFKYPILMQRNPFEA
ncbi:GH3 auxin-responsive promoter family protein [bacterium]|nr:GH3 auxin-responsive promoter family protein [bacterium]